MGTEKDLKPEHRARINEDFRPLPAEGYLL